MRLAIIFMLVPVLGMAQWNQDGDNTSTGNLRIGSSTNDNIQS
ncbi:hypothetical protein DSM03_1174 [Leeuwenhoekiella aestuarii]|nr:hypothetical protein [Leeuwenhoekiella aestuarii]RXG11367.1 hypothetical protein DSM03_1174 [Leeuwenhoekiella aestuarii]